ncbi:hypothetical protein L208DRAFT_501293 [Tricholoma matsutake]|nr:hypothetical protein L208DRAFT_501293 [Tricholoma matsutake 945]
MINHAYDRRNKMGIFVNYVADFGIICYISVSTNQLRIQGFCFFGLFRGLANYLLIISCHNKRLRRVTVLGTVWHPYIHR